MSPPPHPPGHKSTDPPPAGAVPRLVVAGTASGVGKTTVTVGLARAFRALGLRVACFKCGPDYLDPTYHARATGLPSTNLDGWMMGHDAVVRAFHHASRGADLALIEGVMGLFDGATAHDDTGSVAEVARWLEAPVLLVVDAAGMARSIAAVALGFAEFDPRVAVRGLLANRVGSRGHLQILREAGSALPVLGGLPLDRQHRFPERHLGLQTAEPDAVPDSLLETWGQLVAEWVDLPAVLDLARLAPPLAEPPALELPGQGSPSPVRIGVAHDEAFHFYYSENLALLAAAGAELVRFSPIRDQAIPSGVAGLLLGGGYPEVWAEPLSGNASMLESIRRFAAAGGPIYAECGGLMYLARAITTREGERHPMVGLIPGEVTVRDRVQALGYATVTTNAPTVLGPAGVQFRGHQFRYSECVVLPDAIDRRYDVQLRRGGDPWAEGYATANVLASYVHAHWASNPALAEGFVRSCGLWRGSGLGTPV